MIQQSSDYRALVHTPAELATEYVAFAESLQGVAGITWGVPSLDKAIVPMHPGDVIGILARPGHGKSTLAAYVARKVAKEIQANDARSEREAAVYVTFEQSAEEIEAFFQIDANQYSINDLAWGKVDLDTVRRGAVKRLSLPLWVIGESISRRKTMPRMTIDAVYKALGTMEQDFNIKPAIIVLDYIQIVPVDHASERVQQVSEAIIKSKELARRVACPIVMCVQASRAVDKYANKIPTSSDCQWASAIEQTADKLIGIWRPVLTEEPGKMIDIGDREIQITQNLLVARLQKQRMAPAGQTFVLHFAPEWVRLCDMELRSINL